MPRFDWVILNPQPLPPKVLLTNPPVLNGPRSLALGRR